MLLAGTPVGQTEVGEDIGEDVVVVVEMEEGREGEDEEEDAGRDRVTRVH